MKVQCFRYDRWLTVTPDQLEPGDVLNQGHTAVIVSDKPYLSRGQWHVPATQPEQGPIIVDLSNGILAQCMDFVGTGLEVFSDGTAILADLTNAPGYVYSPRLPKAELEAFCTQHRQRYYDFFQKHRDSIDDGKSVAMEPWWLAQ